MENLQSEIRPPTSLEEVARFQAICKLTRIPALLGRIDGEKAKGLIAVIQDDVIIGGICYCVYPLQPRGQNYTTHIDALAVHPDFQHSHVGSRLLSQLIALLRQEGISKVTTIPIHDSENFYLRNGFVPDDSAFVYPHTYVRDL